jgi:Tol biopolymer transport system component
MTRQTFDPRGDFLPQWSPDGDRIVFTSNRTGIAQLFVTATGGGAVEEVLTSGPNSRSLQWTRDGQYVLYANHDQRTQADLWALPLDGGRPPIPVVQTPFAEPNGQVSPDGKWLAYQSNESGRPEVYVQRFPPAGGKISVSSRGGTRPKWRGDGRELYFLSGDELMATPITITPDGIQPQAAVPLLSFTMPTQWDVTYPYEVTRDGQEFFVLEASAEQDVPLVVISGWQARLRH